MESPLVSFVVPTYNFGAYIADCLNSILAQVDYSSFEIIVIDDASTDNTPDVLATFSDRQIIRSRHIKNQGSSATITEGLSKARGAYVARIDGDDRYKPWYLAEVMEAFRTFPDAGLVYGDVSLINAAGELVAERWDGIRSHQSHKGKVFKGNEFLALLKDFHVPAATVIARREAWGLALPIPSDFAFSDWYLTLRMARKYDFVYVPRALADYRKHTHNLHSAKVIDNSWERTVFRVLDQIFSEDDFAEQKRRLRSGTYAFAYRKQGDRYFGANMGSDARRCYTHALMERPSYIFDLGFARRLVASYIGLSRYERCKRVYRSLLKNAWPRWGGRVRDKQSAVCESRCHVRA
jgi:glycosyltransferase involved in cell wall biosynthesis